MTDEPVLRRATADDADAVREIVHQAYRHYEPLIGRTPLPMLTDFDEAILARDVWVLETGDGLAGVIELDVRDDHLWVDNVAVVPELQGRGIGRRLLRHAEEEARTAGRAEIRLLTNERYVENIAMYGHYGYVETHREPYRGTDLVYFRKALEV